MKAKKLEYQTQEFIVSEKGRKRNVYRFKMKEYSGKAYALYNLFLNENIDYNPNVFSSYIRFKNDPDGLSVETTLFDSPIALTNYLRILLKGRELPKDTKVQRESMEKLYSNI